MGEQFAAGSIALLIFRVGSQGYALPVARVGRIIEMVTMLHLPGAPEGVQGIINVQGQMIPVIDLRRRWGLSPQPYTIRTPIILAQGEEETSPVGLIVDQVNEVVEVLPAQWKRIEEIVPGEDINGSSPYLAGVIRWEQQLGILVQVESLLDPAEQAQLAAALDDNDRSFQEQD